MGHLDIKERIVAQFLQEFNKKGYKVTLDGISEKLHISKKTIYKYFASKSDIYLYILDCVLDEVVSRQKEIFDDCSLSISEKIRSILSIHTEWEKEIDFSKMATLLEKEPEFEMELKKAYLVQWDYVRALLEEGKRAGIIREDLDIDLLVLMLSSSYEALYFSGILDKDSYSHQVEKIAGIVLDGCFRKGIENETGS